MLTAGTLEWCQTENYGPVQHTKDSACSIIGSSVCICTIEIKALYSCETWSCFQNHCPNFTLENMLLGPNSWWKDLVVKNKQTQPLWNLVMSNVSLKCNTGQTPMAPSLDLPVGRYCGTLVSPKWIQCSGKIHLLQSLELLFYLVFFVPGCSQ